MGTVGLHSQDGYGLMRFPLGNKCCAQPPAYSLTPKPGTVGMPMSDLTPFSAAAQALSGMETM